MILVVKRISGAMFRRSRLAQEELASLTSFIEENIAAAAIRLNESEMRALEVVA